MNLMIDEAMLVDNFLAENWEVFVRFAAANGYSEEDCETISDKLQGN